MFYRTFQICDNLKKSKKVCEFYLKIINNINREDYYEFKFTQNKIFEERRGEKEKCRR